MKTWLKGGVIGGVLSLIIIPFAITKGNPIKFIEIILSPVIFIIKLLFPCSGESCIGIGLVILPIFTIIYCSIIGGIIGLVIQLIKSKGKNKKSIGLKPEVFFKPPKRNERLKIRGIRPFWSNK